MGSCYSSTATTSLINSINNHLSSTQAPIERSQATELFYPRSLSPNTSSVLTSIPEGIVAPRLNRPKCVAFNETLNVKQLSPVKTKTSPKRLQRELRKKKKSKKEVETIRQEADDPSVVLSYQVAFHGDFAELVVVSSGGEDSEEDNQDSKLEFLQSPPPLKRSKSKLFDKLKATSKKFFHSKSTSQLTPSGESGLATGSIFNPSAIGMSKQQSAPQPSRLRPPIGGVASGGNRIPSISSSTSHLPRLNFGFVKHKTDQLDRTVSNGEGINKNANKKSRLKSPEPLTSAKSIGNVPGEVRKRGETKEFVIGSCDNLAKTTITTDSCSTLSSASSGGFRTHAASSRVPTPKNFGTTNSSSGVSTASSGKLPKSSSSSNISTDETFPACMPPKLPPKPVKDAGTVRAVMRSTASVVRPQTAHIVSTSSPTTCRSMSLTAQQQQRLAFLYGDAGRHGASHPPPPQQQAMLRGMIPPVNGNVARSQYVSHQSNRPTAAMSTKQSGLVNNCYKVPSIYNGESKAASSYPYKRIPPPQTMISGGGVAMINYNGNNLQKATTSGLIAHQQAYAHKLDNTSIAMAAIPQARTTGCLGNRTRQTELKKPTFEPVASGLRAPYYSPSYVRKAATRLNIELMKHKKSDTQTNKSAMDSNGNFVTHQQQIKPEDKSSHDRVMSTDELGERLRRLALLNNNGNGFGTMATTTMMDNDDVVLGNYPHYQLTYNVEDRRRAEATDGLLGANRSEYKHANGEAEEACLSRGTTTSTATLMPSTKVNMIMASEARRRALRAQDNSEAKQVSNYNNNNNNNNTHSLKHNNFETTTSTEELVTTDEEEEDDTRHFSTHLDERQLESFVLQHRKQLALSTYSTTSVCSTASTASSFYYENHKESGAGYLNGAGDEYVTSGNTGLKKSATTSTTTSQSDSVSNKDFLIDDEIADQPELEFMNLNSNQRLETDVMAAAAAGSARLKRPAHMPLEKIVGGAQSTKTLTPASPGIAAKLADAGNRFMLQSVNNELESLISLHSTPTTPSADAYFTSLPAFHESETDASLVSTPTDAGTVINSPGHSPAAQKAAPGTSMNERHSKLRKRHSYTLGGASSIVFRRPRPMSFVEKEDGSISVGHNSVPALMQDVINIKTLLYRLQNDLQNAETQNPFETALSSSRFYSRQDSLDSLHSFGANDKMSVISDQSEESAMHLLKEELMDLKQNNRLMKEQIIEKDRTIRLLQQQMAKYTTSLYTNANTNGMHGDGVNATTQTDPASTGGIDPRALSDGSDGQLVRKMALK